jgi:hypothetical protein
MNPSIDPAIIAAAYEADELAARAEYGAEFRRDLEAFVSREVVEAATVPGRVGLPPVEGTRYLAFADPSGGAQDAHVRRTARRPPGPRASRGRAASAARPAAAGGLPLTGDGMPR